MLMQIIKKIICLLLFIYFLLFGTGHVFSQEVRKINNLSLEYDINDNNIIHFTPNCLHENLFHEPSELLDELIQEAVKKQKNHPVFDLQYAINPDVLKNQILNDLHDYYFFPRHNSTYQKKINEKKLATLIKKAESQSSEVKSAYNLSPEHLRKLILNKLNIRHLVEKLDQQFCIVTRTDIIDYPDYTEEKLVFENRLIGKFAVIVLIPKQVTGKYPVIIGLHGHGQSAEKFKNDFSVEKLAKNGFLVIMPSFRAMGMTQVEYIISKKLLLSGFTLSGIRVFETLLVQKYLKTLNIVDSQKIGILAHSGGSTIAEFIMIILPDIKAIVIDHQSSFIDISDLYGIYDEIIPGLAKYAIMIHNYNRGENNKQLKMEYGKLSVDQNMINFFEKHLQ